MMRINRTRGVVGLCAFVSSLHSTTEAQGGSTRVRVPVVDLREKISSVLKMQGHTATDAAVITDLLMYAELRGNNQGIMKLIAGDLKPNKNQTSTKIVHSTAVSARLDGGQKNGMRCIREALDLAYTIVQNHGVAVIGVSGYSSATGALGYWAREAARKGLICFVASMCPEMVAPHGTRDAVFGTNPIAIGFPRGSPPTNCVVLDMATSSVAWYEVVRANALGRKLPSQIGLTSEGELTDDPAEILVGGALRTFDFGHKGSHLGLMVELLAGAWTGAAMSDKRSRENWGSIVILLDPRLLVQGEDEAGMECLRARVEELCLRVSNARPVPGRSDPIWLPGERGDVQEAAALKDGAVWIERELWENLQKAGRF